MSTSEPGEDTTCEIRRFIGGDPEALDRILRRHNRMLLTTADRLLRRLRLHDPAFGPEDAVSTALLRLCERAKADELASVEGSVQFWQMFYSLLRREIRNAFDRYSATKRGGPGRSPAGWGDQGASRWELPRLCPGSPSPLESTYFEAPVSGGPGPGPDGARRPARVSG